MIPRSLLYIIAILLLVGWAIGFFVWKPGPLIHIMALLAVIAFILGITRKEGIH